MKAMEKMQRESGIVMDESKNSRDFGRNALKREYTRPENHSFNVFDSHFEQNRKNKIKHTKRIYSVCSDFHSGLNLLAISLIDKEVKIYKLKQNGTKVLF